ncbi:MAG: V-type ATP synthase subunit D [Eubacteriales bacterium]
MSILQVSPTRMELSRLKKQLQLSVRGHKLLKDKQDELMRRFVGLIKENNSLRKSTQQRLSSIREKSLLARASHAESTGAIKPESAHLSVDIKHVNMMGLSVPQMSFQSADAPRGSFLDSSPALRESQSDMKRLLPDLLHLAELEKTCVILAEEIEKVRRRVNALEYVTIPQLQETIRFIKMRLEDAERERITRLIKMEDIVTKSAVN